MTGNRQPQKTVPAPSAPQVVETNSDASMHPYVNDNPGEAPQIQMIADAKAIQDAELEANKQASMDAEIKDLKGTTTIVKDEDGEDKEVKASPFTVVATRAGFYKQSRKQEGDKFVIAGAHELGDWMKKI